MLEILNWLDGKKTYILAVIVAVNNLLLACNVYSTEVATGISTVAAALLGGAKLYGNKLGVGR